MWDNEKRSRTLDERGLDFADIANLDWDKALTLEDTRQPYPETRYITFGEINGRLMVIAWCHRGENIRVISMRKANAREIKAYEK